MTVDAFTTSALIDQFNTEIVGGRVQSVIQTSPDSFGFEIYGNKARRYLYMSIDPESARCHLIEDKVRRGVERPSPIGLLLRKNIDGARLMGVHQPDWERILIFHFSGAEGEYRLIVETMGRRSNIILTIEDDILECLRRVGAGQNRYRTILPGQPYVPPPPQDNKLFPEAVTPQQMADFLSTKPDAAAWKAIVAGVAGISPLLAREVIFRSCGDAKAPAFDVDPLHVFGAFSDLIAIKASGAWEPSVVPAEDDSGYLGFAAYPLTHLGENQPVESISAAIAAYSGAPVGVDAYAQAKTGVRKQLDSAQDQARRKLAALKREFVDEEKIEVIRKSGELIYTYATAIIEGQTMLEAHYDLDGPPLQIKIDPALTPVENAQRYFNKYEKSKRAADQIPKRRRRAAHDAAYLSQLALDLEHAESWPEIDMVKEALQKGGYWKGRRPKMPRGGNPGLRRFKTDEGFMILIGRNAAQNHKLLTNQAKPDDLWLHARGIPGSHVIIKNDGRELPDSVIEYAASLAAYYSAGRENGSVEVITTRRRHVRLIKGGRPGMVTYRNETVWSVSPKKD